MVCTIDMVVICAVLMAVSARRLVRQQDEIWPFKAIKDIYKNVVEGDFADYNNGVCFDRAFDHENDGKDFLPFYQDVLLTGAGRDGGSQRLTWAQAVRDRYLSKYSALLEGVRGNVAQKHKKKGNGKPHLESAGVDETLQRMRGFEKCRDYLGLLDRKMAQTCRFRVGKKSHKWFSSDAIKAARPNPQGVKIVEAKCVPDYSIDDAAQLRQVMTEGDDCCQEDCQKGDAGCRPCTPACVRDEKGRISCDVERPFCFEECKDEKGQNRVCTGMKSLARWAAKELKITLSFDTCPDVDQSVGGKRVTGIKRRNDIERQYCGLFDPTSTCHVKLEQLLMRGDANSRWSPEESNRHAIACHDTSELTGDEDARSRDFLKWALKKAVRDNEDAEHGDGKELAKGFGTGLTKDGVQKGKIKQYFLPEGTDLDKVGAVAEDDDDE